ncbi:MAG: DUF3488 and transglutaminase-like domain-containing protein [Caldisericaceae bacterium]
MNKNNHDIYFLLFIISSIGFVSIVEKSLIILSIIPVFATMLSKNKELKKKPKIVEIIPLITFITLLILGIDLFITIAILLTVTISSKYIVSKNSFDYLEMFLIGIMFGLISSIATISISFGIIAVIFTISSFLFLVSAQSKDDKLRHLVDKKDFALSLMFLFILVSVFFLVLPRFSLGVIHGNPLFNKTSSGFSTDITIDAKPVDLNYQIVMRVETEKKKSPLYIVGVRYSTFINNHWMNYETHEKILRTSQNTFGFQFGKKGTVYLEPTGTNVLFQIGWTNGIYGNFNYLLKDELSNMFFDAPFYKTIKYTLYYDDDKNITTEEKDIAKYLSLKRINPKVIELAKDITKNSFSDLEKVEAIVSYLKKNNKYSLKPEANSIEEFIINHRSGYCEHFATATVMLTRANGIPARLVSGFVTNELNNTSNYYIVREKDAHTWVEVYVSNRWITVDPTPITFTTPSKISMLIDSIIMYWYRNVITYSSASQISLYNNIAQGFRNFGESIFNTINKVSVNKPLLIGIGIAIITLFLFGIKLRKEENEIANLIINFIGNDKKDSETLLEFAKRHKKDKILGDLISYYYSYKYGKKIELKNTILKIIKDIKKSKRYIDREG